MVKGVATTRRLRPAAEDAAVGLTSIQVAGRRKSCGNPAGQLDTRKGAARARRDPVQQ